MNTLSLQPAICSIVALPFFYKDGFSIEWPTKVDMSLKRPKTKPNETKPSTKRNDEKTSKIPSPLPRTKSPLQSHWFSGVSKLKILLLDLLRGDVLQYTVYISTPVPFWERVFLFFPTKQTILFGAWRLTLWFANRKKIDSKRYTKQWKKKE